MADFSVRSEDIRQQSARVRQGAAHVSETVGRLSGEIANLAGAWQGAAHDAFDARWQEWQAGAQQIQQAMDDMGTFLDQAAVAYEETEQNIVNAGRSN